MTVSRFAEAEILRKPWGGQMGRFQSGYVSVAAQLALISAAAQLPL